MNVKKLTCSLQAIGGVQSVNIVAFQLEGRGFNYSYCRSTSSLDSRLSVAIHSMKMTYSFASVIKELKNNLNFPL